MMQVVQKSIGMQETDIIKHLMIFGCYLRMTLYSFYGNTYERGFCSSLPLHSFVLVSRFLRHAMRRIQKSDMAIAYVQVVRQ